MSLDPQIALFAALLTALGGPVRAGSPDEGETGERRKTTIGLQQISESWSRPEPPEIESMQDFPTSGLLPSRY
ncbi:MAG: hypothetical protein H6Q00_3437 [Holophagaceae bacterium]|nr:hypothetical protein [Holophagaceae bacterium]